MVIGCGLIRHVGFSAPEKVNLPKPRKVLLGHRNGDITTHYSAPELEELLGALNKVCKEKSGTGYVETKNG
jgi:hypothetical protein